MDCITDGWTNSLNTTIAEWLANCHHECGMNSHYQHGPPRYINQRRGGGGGVGDNWRPSILPPISWGGGGFGRETLPPISWGGGGFRREDLAQDSFHSLNRTWEDEESFYTLSSEQSYWSLLSLSSDEEDSVSDPGDRLLGLLGETEVFRDSLEPLESSPRVPRGRASFPPGSRGQVTTGRTARGRGSIQPSSRGLAWWNSRGGEQHQPEYRVPSPTRWRPAERGLYQYNLRVPPAPVFRRGQAVRGTREHGGGGQPGRVSSEGALRSLQDGDRIQFPHRPESRPLDRLARRHWCQLGLSHRRPIHPALMSAVYYPPRPLPLQFKYHKKVQPTRLALVTWYLVLCSLQAKIFPPPPILSPASNLQDVLISSNGTHSSNYYQGQQRLWRDWGSTPG